MKWSEVKVTTPKENEEAVSGVFYSLGVDALDIEDPNDLVDLSKRDEEWDFFGINIEGMDLSKIHVKAYFSEEEDLERVLYFLKKNIEDKKLGTIGVREFEDQDYLNNWKEYFTTFRVGENIVIKPSWEDYSEEENDIVIDIDPGMAFGTGTHETTSLCIEALEKYISKDDIVFDIGCGSGILSIASVKLGGKRVEAIDLDPTCVRISKDNIIKNKLEDKIKVRQGDLLEVVEGKADIIVSNIIAEVIVDLLVDIREYLKEGGIFIASGIILRKQEMVLEVLKRNNFKIKEIATKGEWSSIVAVKEGA